MESWTADDWIKFLTALGGFVTVLGGVVATIVLQLRGNAKTEAAKAISSDTNLKVTATVAQTRNIADAVPGASTAPTDAVASKPAAVDAARNNGA